MREVIEYVIARVDIRNSEDGDSLSSDAARICALLISMPDAKPSLNPDRSGQYRDTSPAKLLDQLNENWKQLRIFKAAIDDRDHVISTLHESIEQRDVSIKLLNRKLGYARVRIALMYSLLGGIAAKGIEVAVLALLPNLHFVR